MRLLFSPDVGCSEHSVLDGIWHSQYHARQAWFCSMAVGILCSVPRKHLSGIHSDPRWLFFIGAFLRRCSNTSISLEYCRGGTYRCRGDLCHLYTPGFPRDFNWMAHLHRTTSRSATHGRGRGSGRHRGNGTQGRPLEWAVFGCQGREGMVARCCPDKYCHFPVFQCVSYCLLYLRTMLIRCIAGIFPL